MKSILISTSSFNHSATPLLNTLQENGFELIFNPFKRKMTADEVAKYLQEGVVGMIAGVEPLNATVLNHAKSLRVISRCGSGLDSVDLVAAEQKNILVYSTTPPIAAVAELTLTLILTLLRKVIQSDQCMRRGEWKPLMGNLLASKTVGIIGFGHIGMAVAKLVLAFGAAVIVYDEKKISSEQVSLDELLTQSDIITLHLPYNDATYHLLSGEKISLLKPSALLINTSRGGIVDEAALYQALSVGDIAGAGIDVFEKEPYVGPLSALSNVVLTSHMGSYAHETRGQMELEAVQNLYCGLIELGLVRQMETCGEFANE